MGLVAAYFSSMRTLSSSFDSLLRLFGSGGNSCGIFPFGHVLTFLSSSFLNPHLRDLKTGFVGRLLKVIPVLALVTVSLDTPRYLAQRSSVIRERRMERTCCTVNLMFISSTHGFIKTTQCVLAVLPHRLPNKGFSGVSAKILETGISSSHHLKTRTPSCFNTRKHSAKPRRSVSCQSSESVPYFSPIQLLAPLRFKCGGSKTTNAKHSSVNGSSVKSATMSGFIISVRLPPELDLSGNSCVS